MAIALGRDTVLESWASWHEDAEVTRRQAASLAQDALATREKLVRGCLRARFGRLPPKKEREAHLTERQEPGTRLVWVCWDEEALAVRTEPVGSVRDFRYYLRWHWLPVNRRN